MSSFKDYENMAMLDLSDDERVRLKERFEQIAGGFSALDGLDTDDIEPLVSVSELHNIMREDITFKTISRDELLTNAPEQQDGYVSVPAAID